MDPADRTDEVKALRLGIDLGMNLLDTAEMYGEGGSEEVVAEAVEHCRDEVVIVTKIRPPKATRHGTVEYAERSLRLLDTDRIDLYLLHDQPVHPLEETLEAFEGLKRDGKILHYGVSNFDLDHLQRSEGLGLGPNVACNQLRYALTHRALEGEILPWSVEHEIAIMAYSPVGQGRIDFAPELEEVARRHDASPWCIAIAWSMRHPSVVTIPKASDPDHVRDNARALSIVFTEEDFGDLDRAYPRPPPNSFDLYDADPSGTRGP